MNRFIERDSDPRCDGHAGPRAAHPPRALHTVVDLGLLFLRAAACAAMLTMAGCVYYGPPVATIAVPANFDRAFSAAAGALRDQGLAISVEDRGSGSIVGRSGNATVTASVLRQADGTVRVQFDATGPRDPALIDRVSRGYDARMGR